MDGWVHGMLIGIRVQVPARANRDGREGDACLRCVHATSYYYHYDAAASACRRERESSHKVARSFCFARGWWTEGNEEEEGVGSQKRIGFNQVQY